MHYTLDINNPIFNTDSYKFSHYLQYPEDVKQVSEYIEPRWNHEHGYDDIMFFGLQMFLKKYLTKPILSSHIDEAEKLITTHGLPFNRKGFERIVDVWGGYWPVIIQALPEGTVHKHGVTQVQVHNIDPELPWVSTFVETALLRAVWYPTNVATRSFHVKRIIRKWLEKSADNLDSLNFKLHDFGCRGASSLETAAIGGTAHLVNFLGTDTVPALIYANNFYSEPCAGFSIPAAEHSTITSWGRKFEQDAYENMLLRFGGKGKMFAMVLDSYDVHNALENIVGGTLFEWVKRNGAVVGCRLDSGDPITEPAKAMNILGKKFGFTTNSKGYKMLPPYLRIVQGDGVNVEMIDECCDNITQHGWSVDNIGTFGMGGELLQKHDRDTHGYAMKCNAVNKLDENGWYDICKNPVGDATKSSKAGRRAVLQVSDIVDWREDSLTDYEISCRNMLQRRFEGGALYNTDTLSNIRERANSYLVGQDAKQEAEVG